MFRQEAMCVSIVAIDSGNDLLRISLFFDACLNRTLKFDDHLLCTRLTYTAPVPNSWGFDAVGRGEVVVNARWHFDKHYTRRQSTILANASTFMGSAAKVSRGSG